MMADWRRWRDSTPSASLAFETLWLIAWDVYACRWFQATRRACGFLWGAGGLGESRVVGILGCSGFNLLGGGGVSFFVPPGYPFIRFFLVWRGEGGENWEWGRPVRGQRVRGAPSHGHHRRVWPAPWAACGGRTRGPMPLALQA